MAVHTAGFVPAFPQIDLDATSLAHEINNNGGIGALQMLGIKHPVILAGMNAVAHADGYRERSVQAAILLLWLQC